MKNPRRRLYNFHVRRRDERNSFLLNPVIVVLKRRAVEACPPSLFLSLYNSTLLSLVLYHLRYSPPPYLYHSLFCMPHPPKPYPSFTSVMSSAPFAPFAANDNMRLPAYRTSHLARFHPYSRAQPSIHRDRHMVRLSRVCCSLHAQQPQPTRLQWIIVFLSLLGALFEAWPQSR